MIRVKHWIVATAVSVGLFTGFCPGQTPVPVERRSISRIAPVYPEMARRLGIAGAVKLEIVVRANGTVKSTRTVGGNPVLIQSAINAVLKWKFEPATAETTGTVELTFGPRHQ
jgi:protein TonB